jgi:hypothetical protein
LNDPVLQQDKAAVAQRGLFLHCSPLRQVIVGQSGNRENYRRKVKWIPFWKKD